MTPAMLNEQLKGDPGELIHKHRKLFAYNRGIFFFYFLHPMDVFN